MRRDPGTACGMALAGSPRHTAHLAPALACETSVALCGRSCYARHQLCSCLFTLLVNEETSSCHPGPHGSGKAASPSILPRLLLTSRCWASLGRKRILLAEKGRVNKEGIQSRRLGSHGGCKSEACGCLSSAGAREKQSGHRHQAHGYSEKVELYQPGSTGGWHSPPKAAGSSGPCVSESTGPAVATSVLS